MYRDKFSTMPDTIPVSKQLSDNFRNRLFLVV